MKCTFGSVEALPGSFFVNPPNRLTVKGEIVDKGEQVGERKARVELARSNPVHVDLLITPLILQSSTFQSFLS